MDLIKQTFKLEKSDNARSSKNNKYQTKTHLDIDHLIDEGAKNYTVGVKKDLDYDLTGKVKISSKHNDEDIHLHAKLKKDWGEDFYSTIEYMTSTEKDKQGHNLGVKIEKSFPD
jgi:hypothetical protein